VTVKSTALTIFSAPLRSAQPLACRLFESALSNGKVANAYLLVGRDAEMKQQIAKQVAAFANCGAANRDERGSCLAAESDKTNWCTNCKWIGDSNHPQAWMTISGEGASGKVPVEKVRALSDELGKTSNFVRVILVPDASETSFHRPAANALLKSIEEPPPNCLFFFFADSTDDVLATIVSRCQVVPVNRGMELGYWKAQLGSLDESVIKKLEAARAEFVTNARKQFAPGRPYQYVRGVGESLDLAKVLKDLCAELENSMDEYEAADRLLDLFVACEIEVLKEAAYDDAACTRYVSGVCDLAEKCKRQIGAYVKQANAIDSFVLGLNDLRNAHSGEFSCAKY
jgi:DNA polymerase III delta prime subunit